MKKILAILKKLFSGNKAEKAIAAVQVAKEVKQVVKKAPIELKPKKVYKPKPKSNSL